MYTDYIVSAMYGSCRLPGAHVDERHGRVAEIPDQKEIAVVCVAVALVLLSQGDAVNASIVGWRMMRNPENFKSIFWLTVNTFASLEI